MNNITADERQKILNRALKLVRLDKNLVVTNGPQVIDRLQKEFSISRQRAVQAMHKAARLRRYRSHS